MFPERAAIMHSRAIEVDRIWIYDLTCHHPLTFISHGHFYFYIRTSRMVMEGWVSVGSGQIPRPIFFVPRGSSHRISTRHFNFLISLRACTYDIAAPSRSVERFICP